MLILYQENKFTKAVYFDNEGHIINYAVSFSQDSSSVIFISDIIANSPRFRFIYTKASSEGMKFNFDFASPGKPEEFSKYLDGFVKKIK
jgi:hypothetical protein